MSHDQIEMDATRNRNGWHTKVTNLTKTEKFNYCYYIGHYCGGKHVVQESLSINKKVSCQSIGRWAIQPGRLFAIRIEPIGVRCRWILSRKSTGSLRSKMLVTSRRSNNRQCTLRLIACTHSPLHGQNDDNNDDHRHHNVCVHSPNGYHNQE